MIKYLTVTNENWNRARSMRKEPTRAEKKLWRHLRANQTGHTFRRQHPIGPYIADCVCLELMLIIELDGGGHCEPDQIEHDAVRDEYLQNRGFRVFRFSNRDILSNMEGAIKRMCQLLDKE